MIFVFSGEGMTDIGGCRNGQDRCEGSELQPGPMMLLADQVAKPECNYSPLEAGACILVTEGRLARIARHELGPALPKKGSRADTAYHFKSARALARVARETATDKGCPVAGILFHDADGTRSADRDHRKAKVASMYNGFDAESFPFGVPMVPMPKSEAWLLCAVQEQPYQNCARLENISGNDDSKEPAKGQFEKALAARGKTYDDVCDLIRDGQIQATRICMPSFNEFRDRLQMVIRAML